MDFPEESPGLREPIAIIGIGCRLPGNIHGPDAFWDLLLREQDVITEVPPDRWDVDAFYDPDPGATGKMYTRYGGFIENVEDFDPAFFQISPREAAVMDPEQRMLLEVVWEALEHAGQAPSRLAGTDTGVFLGISNGDYQIARQFVLGAEAYDTYAATGGSLSVAAGRISYVLGLSGPAVALDTACSSSLVAVHQACMSLRLRESSMALAGGVSLILAPFGIIMRSQARMMSPDGRCHTFDADANGYVRSEGCGMVVLKRLGDAIADGDRVLAVIRGSAVNQDGRTPGLTAPSETAQQAVIRAALANAGVGPSDVQYVEAHGTGTRLGDPIELRALGAVFADERSQPLYVGSVKTNVGHTEAAAGIIGLIKAALALERGAIPGQLNWKKGNPDVDWESLRLRVVTELNQWPDPDGRRIAGVSSFGFSGTNAHVVLEAAVPAPTKVSLAPARKLQLLPLSAQTRTALDAIAGQYASFLKNTTSDLVEIAAEAGIGRAHMDERLAVLASTPEEAAEKLIQIGSEMPLGSFRGARQVAEPSVAFLFTGQGALYPGMGADLYESEPVFRGALDRIAELADPHLDRPLLDVIFGRTQEDADLSNQALYAQPALFCIEYGLAQLWKSWGVRPAAVMGHSLGEYAAASTAGIWSLEDAVRLVVRRGALMQALPERPAAMAAVMAEEGIVRAAVARYGIALSVAALNGPENVVVSGDGDAVDAICDEFDRAGISSKKLRVSHAFHSPHMDPMLDAFEDVAATVEIMEPEIPLVSSLTGRFASVEELAEPDYWRREIREAVQFAPGMRVLWDSGIRTFLEIGPHPVLIGMGRACVDSTEAAWLPSMRRGAETEPVILESLARLYVQGIDVDWSGVYAGIRRSVVLPTYPFQRERHGPDLSRATGPSASRNEVGGIPLLGRPIDSPLIEGLLFETTVGVNSPGFLTDHRVHGSALVPGMAFLQMAFAAAAHLPGDERFELVRLTVKKALVLPEEGIRRMQVALKPVEDGGYLFEVHSRGDEDAGWTQHAVGHLQVDPGKEVIASENPRSILDAASLPEDLEEIDVEEYYETSSRQGTRLGPSFRGMRKAVGRSGLSLGHIRLEDNIRASGSNYVAHPILYDGAIQVMCAVMPDDEEEAGVPVPVGVRSVRVYQTDSTEAWVRAICHAPENDDWDIFSGDIYLHDAVGNLIAALEGVEMRRVRSEVLHALVGKSAEAPLYQVIWKPAVDAHARSKVDGNWLLFSDEGGVGAELAERLEAAGAQCTVLPRELVDASGDDSIKALLDGVIEKGPIRGIVYLWGLDRTNVDTGSDLEGLAATRGLLSVAQSVVSATDALPRLWVATRGARRVTGEPTRVDPNGAPLWGLCRTILQEHPPLRPTCIDLDPYPGSEAGLLYEALARDDDELEVAYRDGKRYVARMNRYGTERANWPWNERKPFRLHIARRGSLDQLVPIEASRRAPGPGEVELRVLSTGLNFRDVLNALGMYPGDPGAPGGECAGRVVRVGEGVTHLRPGDEVFGLAQGAYSTYVNTPGAFVAKKPARLSFDEAATLPITFLTAYYGFHHLARLSPADRVLIHSAAGGVGQAAIQFARRAGATIFATAGSPEKRDFLRRAGIEYVMDSRSQDYVEEILSATRGDGITLILNALTGEYVDAGLDLLRNGGYFLEIGKRDIRDPAAVAADHPGVNYVPYDLGDVMRDQPMLIQEMLGEIAQAIEDGSLKPLRLTSFPVWEIPAAFRYMARARHIGKVVVSQDDEESAEASIIRSDATYLITGGLGGLGLGVADRFASRGASHLVLIGRSDPDDAASSRIEALEKRGVNVRVERLDVCDREAVLELATQLKTTMPPLRGVVHAAGVLDDGVLTEQSWGRFEKAMAPKVIGTLNLHEATLDADLDFFVFCSSIAAALGSAGQANYAAANAFLNGFAEFRRSVGLPATSVCWGPWAQVGMAARLGATERRRLEATGIRLIQPEQGLDLLERILKDQQRPGAQAVSVVMPIDWSRYEVAVLRGRTRSLLADLVQVRTNGKRESAAADVDLRARLRATMPAERIGVVTEFLRQRISRITGIPVADVSPRRPLTQMGLDSLMAVEFKGQVEAGLRATVAVNTLLRGASLEEVAEELLTQLDDAVAPVAESPLPMTPERATVLLEQVDTLPPEEVNALLEQIGPPGNVD